MKKGLLITFESGEACGKTTQIALFKEYLEKKGIDYIALREPGGTIVGEEIRKILLSKEFNIDCKTEALLFNAARAKLCEEKIKPALAEGKLVVMDRFYHSTLVYQAISQGNDPKELMPLINYATGGLRPDLTFILSLPAEISFARKEQENKQDRIESRGLDFYKKIEKGFAQLSKLDKDIIKVIDATDTIEGVQKQIINEFEKFYQ